MRGRSVVIAAILLAGMLGMPASAGERDAAELYRGMIAALRAAKTLSFTCECRGETEAGKAYNVYRYRALLAKPNFARVEVTQASRVTGVLVLDGTTLWVHWPPGRFPYNWERAGRWADEYERTKDICFMKKPAANGAHSIGHEMCRLGPGVRMNILDLSTFHGYSDSMQRYLDGAEYVGSEKVGEEECEVFDVGIMRGQRSWRFWVSKADRLPRMILQTVRGSRTFLSRETWSDLVVDAEIPEENFTWSQPEGWVEWRLPEKEEGLLKAGSEAPKIDLPLVGGGRFRSSDARGKIVWIYVWRAG